MSIETPHTNKENLPMEIGREIERETGSRSRLFEIVGHPNLLFREMPGAYGSVKMTSRRRDQNVPERIAAQKTFEETLKKARRYFDVLEPKPLVYEGERGAISGAVVERIEGVVLSDMALTKETFSIFDEHAHGTLSLCQNDLTQSEVQIPDDLSVEQFMYGHRISSKGKAIEKDRIVLVDVDPDYIDNHSGILKNISFIIFEMEEMIEDYINLEGKNDIHLPKFVQKLKELLALLETDFVPKDAKERLSDAEKFQLEILAEGTKEDVRRALELLGHFPAQGQYEDLESLD